MYPGTYAAMTPDKVAAVLVETGETLSYGELDERSIRLSRVLYEAGLRRGDVVALLTENNLRAFEVYWAAMRSGLYITAINHQLVRDEAAYIVDDSEATALIVSFEKRQLAASILDRGVNAKLLLSYGGAVDGFDSYEDALAATSAAPLTDQPQGARLLYSSGTTGRPKGVKPALPDVQVDQPGEPLVTMAREFFGVDERTTYLSPAPLYHAAPLGWCGTIHANGGTVVMMRKFSPESCLRAIEEFGVTHAQFVPTMFIRLLHLEADVRTSYSVSTLRYAIHAAAPCPAEVKRKMIDWWGPILVEYYAGTEANGMTVVDSATWRARPGTVGRPIFGTVRICGEDGSELLPYQIGTIYMERDTAPFVYHNDPEKTLASRHPHHPSWTAIGDIGYVDDDGFLYLTGRKAFTIISGGVNIYPQEIEDALALHPAILDVAVLGVPDSEMGESVKAFVQPRPGVNTGVELEREIITFVKSKIAGFKAPKTVQFVDDMPRTEAGKLVKEDLRRKYVLPLLANDASNAAIRTERKAAPRC